MDTLQIEGHISEGCVVLGNEVLVNAVLREMDKKTKETIMDIEYAY